jgi:Double-GTPase 2
MSVEKLVAVLYGVGIKVTAPDILDLLWLAPKIGLPAEDLPDGSSAMTPRPASSASADIVDEAGSVPDPEQSAALHVRRPRGQQHNAPEIAAVPVAAPEAPALSDKLGLSRSFRPLKKRKHSVHENEIDEVATAQFVAQSGLWMPAMRPKRVRWMDLALVVDSGESMHLWQQTVHEFRGVLEDLGAFRDIRVWFLDWGSSNDVRIRIKSSRNNSSTRSPREIIEPSGSRIVIIFSDCVSARWQSDEIRDVIRRWAVSGPVAIAQPLPQQLWDYTNISPERVRFKALEAGVPNNKIWCQYPDSLVLRRGGAVAPIPIVELSSASAVSWSRLVSASGADLVPGSAMLAGIVAESDPEPPVVPPQPFTPSELVQRFQLVASPNAMRLAECLAAAPVSIPVMHLIQDAVLDRADHAAVAEVFLGGLLCKTELESDTDHSDEQYDFAEGVREHLLARLPRSRALEILLAVADSIGARLGRGQDFRALVAGDGIGGDLVLDRDSRPFALVAEQVLSRMGTDFAKSAGQLRDILDADPVIRRYRISRDPGRGPTLPEGAGVLTDNAALDGVAAAEILPAESPSDAVVPDAAQPGNGMAPDRVAPDGVGPADGSDGRPENEWRAFGVALGEISLPKTRSRARPLVCPYCYRAFSEREILFRCAGDPAPGRAACDMDTDPVLQREMNVATPVLPVFESSARRDEAQCKWCRGITAYQVCPNCHSSLPPKFASVDSRLIALVGSSEAGKTAFMTVLIHELRRSIGASLESATRAADATTQDRFDRRYERPLYQDGSLFQRTATAGQEYIRPLVFRFTMPGRSRVRARSQEILLSFADSAGEDLASTDKLDLMARYLAAADAVVVMVDPLQIEDVRHRITAQIALPARPGPAYDPVASVERITRLLTAVSRSDVIDKPMAVTVTKLDALWDLLPEDSCLRRVSPATSVFDLADSDEVQHEVRNFLAANRADAINRTMMRRYSNSRYFAVSALGAPPTSSNSLSRREIQPHRIADPMLWILSEFGMGQRRGRR